MMNTRRVCSAALMHGPSQRTVVVVVVELRLRKRINVRASGSTRASEARTGAARGWPPERSGARCADCRDTNEHNVMKRSAFGAHAVRAVESGERRKAGAHLLSSSFSMTKSFLSTFIAKRSPVRFSSTSRTCGESKSGGRGVSWHRLCGRMRQGRAGVPCQSCRARASSAACTDQTLGALRRT